MGGETATGTWEAIHKRYREAIADAAVPSVEKARWRRMLVVEELFARAYAQWIAWKSGDRTMLAQLEARSTATELRMRLRQWPLDEWLSIAPAMDTLFKKAGWLE